MKTEADEPLLTPDEETALRQFPPCTVAGCDRTCAAPPCKTERGELVCCKHGAELAGGKCEGCGKPFNPNYSGYDVYAIDEFACPNSRELRFGAAVCLDCWTQ
jgi:hypothetical protein